MDREQPDLRCCSATPLLCAAMIITAVCFGEHLAWAQDFLPNGVAPTTSSGVPLSGPPVSHQRPRAAGDTPAPATVLRANASEVVGVATPKGDGWVAGRTPIPLKPRPNGLPDSGTTNESTDGKSHESGSSAGSILIVMTVAVIFLLGLAALVFRKSPYSVKGLPREAVDVLGRRTVDPRNSIYVVQVGGKMVLLGASANGLTPLSEITDPVEVATLANLCAASRESAPAVGNWLKSFMPGAKTPSAPASFENRLGEELFAQAQQGEPGTVTSLTARPAQEGRRVRQ